MTVLEALELMLRSGIRRVYYQEGKLPRDSGSEVSLSQICATRRHMCLSLSLYLLLCLSTLPARIVARSAIFSLSSFSFLSSSRYLSTIPYRDQHTYVHTHTRTWIGFLGSSIPFLGITMCARLTWNTGEEV